MADDTSLVKVVASTTDVADVGMNDDRLWSVDARLRRRRKLAPARSNSISLSIASSVSDTKPCPLTRSRMLAVNFPPPRGPCLAIRGRAFFSSLSHWAQLHAEQPHPPPHLISSLSLSLRRLPTRLCTLLFLRRLTLRLRATRIIRIPH